MTDNNRTYNRQFSFTEPIMYQGEEYPSTDAMISDGRGNEVAGSVFTDANGQYYTMQNGNIQSVTPVHTLDEVTVTAPKRYNAFGNNWDSPAIKSKEYGTTLMGLATGLWDKFKGNNTYKVNPLDQGEVRPYNPDEVDWWKTRRSQNKVVNAISGTWGPLVAAALMSPLVRAFISAPIATAATFGGGYAGGKAVDKASKFLTGRDFGTNVAMHTPLTPGMGDMLNPGYVAGGYGTPRSIAAGDFLKTTLTGKSTKFLKPITREYLGKPYYDNIRPSGYGIVEKDAMPRNTQVKNMFIDFLKPRFFRNNVSDPNYRPKWLIDKDNPINFEVLRNDAHRLSMGLDAHQELLSDGKMHSLYVKKPNGNYDIDWDYVRHVKTKYPDNDLLNSLPADFPNAIRYFGDPSSGEVVANDRITLNGGFANYKFLNPKKLRTVKSAPGLPTHYSTGDVLFTDTWNVQPFQDSRTYWPWLTRTMTSIENKNIPVLSKVAHNVKNVELVDALGGKPFTQETLLPDQTIYWYPKNETLEQVFSRQKNSGTKKYKYETLKW